MAGAGLAWADLRHSPTDVLLDINKLTHSTEDEIKSKLDDAGIVL